MQVIRVQLRDEASQWERVLATGLRDAQPMRERCAAAGRPRSARHGAMPRGCADVALGRVVRRRDVGAVDKERDAYLVDVEPFLEPNDVGEGDPVGAVDDLHSRMRAHLRALASSLLAAALPAT